MSMSGYRPGQIIRVDELDVSKLVASRETLLDRAVRNVTYDTERRHVLKHYERNRCFPDSFHVFAVREIIKEFKRLYDEDRSNAYRVVAFAGRFG